MQDAVVEPGVDPTPAPADGYAVTILMSDATVDALAAGGFALQGFAAVRTTALDAHPLVPTLPSPTAESDALLDGAQ